MQSAGSSTWCWGCSISCPVCPSDGGLIVKGPGSGNSLAASADAFRWRRNRRFLSLNAIGMGSISLLRGGGLAPVWG